MKFIKYSILFSVACLLGSCASDYKKYRKAPIGPYIHSLEIRHHKNVYEHPSYGRMEVAEEPLKTISDKCTEKAYDGKRVRFDGLVISDPDILYEINADYIRHLFDPYGNFSLPAMAFRRMKTNHQDQWKIIEEASGAKTRCIKSHGWRFLKRG